MNTIVDELEHFSQCLDEGYFKTRFVILDDGSLWMWADGWGIADPVIWLFFAGIGTAIGFGVGLAVYPIALVSAIFIVRHRSSTPQIV
jgi:hypothetical protein